MSQFLSRRRLLKAVAAMPVGFTVTQGALANQPVSRPRPQRSTALLNESADRLTTGALPDMAQASQYGARFDGVSDDCPALQHAVDDAAKTGRALILPAGTALLGSPLDLRGRYVAIRGQSTAGTKLVAAREMPSLVEAGDPADVLRSPLFLTDMTLDGNNVARCGLNLRYRHHSVLSNVHVTRAETAISEHDCWLSRRSNCIVSGSSVGWELGGSNHSSLWEGCSFTGCSDVHLRIGSGGTANDGNLALLFRSCDIEFGDGVGVDVSPGADAVFDSCYIGEHIKSEVVLNRGRVVIRDGVLFFGTTARSSAVVPLGGTTRFEGVRLSAQGAGVIGQLIGRGLNDAQLSGRVAFRRVEGQMIVGGNPILPGDVLESQPMRVFAKPLGKDWQLSSQRPGLVTEVGSGSTANARTLKCLAASDGAAEMGLYSVLTDTSWRDGEPVYIVVVYRSTRPLSLRLSRRPFGVAPAYAIGELPASPVLSTYVKLDVTIPRAAYQILELSCPAARGDQFTIHSVGFSDNGFHKSGTASFKNLALPE